MILMRPPMWISTSVITHENATMKDKWRLKPSRTVLFSGDAFPSPRSSGAYLV